MRARLGDASGGVSFSVLSVAWTRMLMLVNRAAIVGP
jgi:hypothetical protein